jgi:ABC-type polar amino acid transport system ATPase subunit
MKIELKNLSHTYDVEVLHDLNLVLDKYNAVAILGVSGSGKSTLIRLMAGLEKPTSGDIFVNDYDVIHDVDYKKHVGFVFQSHNLFLCVTLKRNISLILEKTRGYSKEDAEKIAIEYLTLLKLDDQMDKIPKNVSGGQAQRASIARALSVNPDVIFLDEPTASLDPILTDEVLKAIEELKELGKDFILVTHVISFVRDFANYVVFMENGHIIEQGTPSILDAPKTPELKAFMKKVR